MLDAYLITFCSPTLAGIKAGSLFNINAFKESTLCKDIRRLEPSLKDAGLAWRLFPRHNSATLFYLYREKDLQEELSDPLARPILKASGYTSYTPSEALRTLGKRIYREKIFPHEIGLFLSYPPEDVRDFITLGPRRCRMRGHWCVFGDVEKARACFARYDRCRKCYERRFAHRKDLRPLLVSH